VVAISWATSHRITTRGSSSPESNGGVSRQRAIQPIAVVPAHATDRGGKSKALEGSSSEQAICCSLAVLGLGQPFVSCCGHSGQVQAHRGRMYLRPADGFGRSSGEFGCIKFRPCVTDGRSHSLARGFLEQSPELSGEFKKDFKTQGDPRINAHRPVHCAAPALMKLPSFLQRFRDKLSVVGA